jgi:hypothetical protein
MFSDHGNINKDGVCSGFDEREMRWPNYSTYHTFPNPFPDGSSWVKPFVVKAEYERGAFFAEVMRDIEVPADRQMARQMAWNCPLANTAWELIPFSFVVDWFVDVGTYIHNLEKLTLGVSERAKMGAIWHSCQTRVATYRPALEFARWYIEAKAAPSDPTYGGILAVRSEWGASPVLEDVETVYNRQASTRPALPDLQTMKTVKAYQISTGMALIAQAAFG